MVALHTTWIAIHLAAADPVRLTVDAAALGAVHGPPLEQKLTASVRAALRDADVELDDAAPRALAIHVRWSDAHAFHYGIAFAVLDVGVDVPRLDHAFECADCTMAAVVERVDAELPVITAWLRADASQQDPVADPPARHPGPRPSIDPAPSAADGDDHRASARTKVRPIGGLGIAGSTLIGAGAIAIVPGAIYVARGDRRTYDETGYAGTIRHFGSVGHPVLWSGVAAVGVGIVLLGIDFGLSRAARKHVIASVASSREREHEPRREPP